MGIICNGHLLTRSNCKRGLITMNRRLIILALTLLGAFALAVLAGAQPGGLSLLENSASAEERTPGTGTLLQQGDVNQQAISDAIAAHGTDKWHEAGFTGAGVKIGVIDRGFAGIREHMGTEVPEPVGVRCYFPVQDFTITDNFTEDIADCENEELGEGAVGAAILEAVYDIAPDADYYIASISQDRFYHFDLIGIVGWMNGEGVDLILFTHDGGWSGPGDGTSIYPASELKTLDTAVSLGMTWISPVGDRAKDAWSGIFTDSDGNGVHEFAQGVECNRVTLGPNSAFAAQIRWNDPWSQVSRDLEVALIDETTGNPVAFSGKHHDLPDDPNELLTFDTPDTQTSYCLKVTLTTAGDAPPIFHLQSWNGHSFEHPYIYGSVTSPAESVNTGMLAVGAAAWDNNTEIRPFSGRGPMFNRTTKPDVVGGDGARSAVLGKNWESTAQAAAHVAGLSVLVKQRFPDYSPTMIANYLRDNAESRPAEAGDRNQSPDNNNTWGHGFAMLPDDVEGVTPPSQVDPLQATKDYVDEAIRRYRADPEGAKEYYRTRESFVNDPPGLYLLLLEGDTIVVNGAFPAAETSGISWRDDPLGNMYGARLAAADEEGVEVEYLIPVGSDNYTFRKKTSWSVRADGLVFSAGWLDLETDVESTFTEAQKAVGEVIEARARVQAEGAIPTLNHYQTSGSIDGEYYVWLAYPTGRIVADATMPELEGQNIADAYPPEVAQEILEVQSLEARWVSHMWQNPATGQEELKHTYVTRFFGFYIVSGYYDAVPPIVGPRAAAQAYVEEAIRRYRADPDEAKAYYQSEASVDRENDLYLILIDGTEIIVNGGFSGVVGDDITGRIGTDAIGKEYGQEIAAAGETGRFVTYLIPDPLRDFTLYRKHTWAIKADGLIFAAGSWDRTEDVESALEPHEHVVATIYKAAARLLVSPITNQQELIQALIRISTHYNNPASIDGERYVFIAAPEGTIAADATRPDLLRTNIADLQASDDPALGRKIAAVQEGEELWISHMWRNPATGQEEQKYTYVTRFLGIIFGSGYYGGEPPPGLADACLIPIDGAGTHIGAWDETCLSENRPQDSEGGGRAGSDYYARFYTFTLGAEADVTISLSSDVDTFLYVREGSGSGGSVAAFNDDLSTDDRNSLIEDETLDAGTYTIEATTYDAEAAGSFTLVVEIEYSGDPPGPPAPDVTYIAISSGANHVCAIAADGSIMCWGNEDGDSHGQISDRPTSGSFTEISSGDNHTCALRDDGAVICWGSITVP